MGRQSQLYLVSGKKYRELLQVKAQKIIEAFRKIS